MFNFEDGLTVKKVVGLLPRVGVGVKYGIHQQRLGGDDDMTVVTLG